jgi:hypothetical protein
MLTIIFAPTKHRKMPNAETNGALDEEITKIEGDTISLSHTPM